MAIIKRGILGGFSKKIGNIVGSSWKGIAVMKSLPLTVANPRTTAQVNQRSKFKGCTQFASIILSGVIKPLWDRFAQQKSGFNAWVQRNIINFDDNGGVAIAANLIISEGKLGNLAGISIVADSVTDQLGISWTGSEANSFNLPTDEVFILVYNNTTEKLLAYGAISVRSALTVNFQAQPFSSGNQLVCLFATRAVDGTIVSNTLPITVTAA